MQRTKTILILGAAVALGCSQDPSDLRPWRPSDHGHTNNPNAAQVNTAATNQAEVPPGLDDVTVVTWRRNCTRCHGAVGRADGPQAPMYKPTDLSDPRWQASATDDAIAAVIKSGRGKMPAFDLPAQTISNLVKLVRLLDRSRAARRAPAASASAPAAPSGSAPRPPPSAAPSAR